MGIAFMHKATSVHKNFIPRQRQFEKSKALGKRSSYSLVATQALGFHFSNESIYNNNFLYRKKGLINFPRFL